MARKSLQFFRVLSKIRWNYCIFNSYGIETANTETETWFKVLDEDRDKLLLHSRMTRYGGREKTGFIVFLFKTSVKHRYRLILTKVRFMSTRRI